MKNFYIEEYLTVIRRVIIKANSEKEAEEIYRDYDLSLCTSKMDIETTGLTEGDNLYHITDDTDIIFTGEYENFSIDE